MLAVLYSLINLDSTLAPTRDRVIFSKGWAAASAYHFLATKEILTEQDLETYGEDGGLIGLVERSTRGIEATTGAMGHGLPIGLGMALAAKRLKEKWKTYVLMSDGEMDCGTTWESAMLAAHHALDNLIVIIDYNKMQAMGFVEDILNIEPLYDKWEAFGWEVREVDGHNLLEIEAALTYPRLYAGKPLVLIAHTIKGKGVSFMENKLEWHYRNIDDEHYAMALAEL